MKTLEISEETYQKIKNQLAEDEQIEINSYEDFVGQKVFLRTVTYHIVGKVTKMVGNLMFLKDASWVADSGRFMQAIRDGSLKEVEPVGDWFVNVGSLVDGGIWKHKLPKEQK